ncbi:hypothetical protein GJAV_G00146600 [Gymnothorax javanicus]|nr:hypothetical protein GJAV_G00146600 [Gymnothorax javanicus]
MAEPDGRLVPRGRPVTASCVIIRSRRTQKCQVSPSVAQRELSNWGTHLPPPTPAGAGGGAQAVMHNRLEFKRRLKVTFRALLSILGHLLEKSSPLLSGSRHSRIGCLGFRTDVGERKMACPALKIPPSTSPGFSPFHYQDLQLKPPTQNRSQPTEQGHHTTQEPSERPFPGTLLFI